MTIVPVKPVLDLLMDFSDSHIFFNHGWSHGHAYCTNETSLKFFVELTKLRTNTKVIYLEEEFGFLDIKRNLLRRFQHNIFIEHVLSIVLYME